MGRIVLPVYTPYYIPNGNEVAVIETSRGTIRVQLAGKLSLIHISEPTRPY